MSREVVYSNSHCNVGTKIPRSPQHGGKAINRHVTMLGGEIFSNVERSVHRIRKIYRHLLERPCVEAENAECG